MPQSDETVRAKHWKDLLVQLRKLNPTQKFKYDDKSECVRSLSIDGVEVELRLDEQRSGGWLFYSHGNGIYCFTIGAYRRHYGVRPRAVQKKTGFDWAKIAQLVEDERKYILAKNEDEVRKKDVLTCAGAALDALFKRRPELEDKRSLIDISSRTGKFTFTVYAMDIWTLERVLDIAMKTADES
jgi:hypothetical protein